MKRAVALSFFLACAGVLLGETPESRDPRRLLRDLVRLTNDGVSDMTVLAYARAHRLELPPEVSADDLLWLRRSGVSEPVIRYMSAIDVRASDTGLDDVVAYDDAESAGYSGIPADSYSVADSGGYADYGYPDYAAGDYEPYPATYYNDYYPFYGAAYYPLYPAYFFVNQGGFFRRFPGRRHEFVGGRGHSGGRGDFRDGRGRGGDFDRGRGGRRGNVIAGNRESVRPVTPRGNFGQGLRPRGDVVRRAGPGQPAFSRGNFAHGPSGPRGGVMRNSGAGRPAFSGGSRGGGSVGRAPVARSGGGGSAGRPAAVGRR